MNNNTKSDAQLPKRAAIQLTRANQESEDTAKRLADSFPHGTVIDSDRHITLHGHGISWIQLIAESWVWKTVLGAPVAVYLTRLAQHAADHTWNKREAIVAAARDAAAKPLRDIATAVHFARLHGEPTTPVLLGVPVPDDHFATVVTLDGDSIEDVVHQLACFVDGAELIDTVVNKIRDEDEDGIQGRVSLLFEPSGLVRLRWLTLRNVRVVEVKLELPSFSRSTHASGTGESSPCEASTSEPISVDFGK